METFRRVFDVVVVGGGIAGSCFGGVMARAGLGVLVVERESQFRDRVRGEGIRPWGVAEARRAGLSEVLTRSGGVELRALQTYSGQKVNKTFAWLGRSSDGQGEIGFTHTAMQEAALSWARGKGAVVVRPAKATAFRHTGHPELTIVQDGCETIVSARLVVGADGKLSGTRRWTGGTTEADPEHHRMGGVALDGVVMDRSCDCVAGDSEATVNWCPNGVDTTRLYLVAKAEYLRATGADRSVDAALRLAARHTPEHTFDHARQIGPLAYHPNNDIWASKIAGNDVVLIGDAAGAPDPTSGHGTSCLFRDIRELSELLLGQRDWRGAIGEYAIRRTRYFAVVREYDRWKTSFGVGEIGSEADRRRERYARAMEADPTLGGFALLSARGPDGLRADDIARRHFFGEDLP